MRVLAVATVVVLATSVGVAAARSGGPAPLRVTTMAGSAADAVPDLPPDPTTTTAPALPTVPATVPATLPSVPPTVPVTLPKVTLPKLPRPRPSTTTTTRPAPPPPSGNRCGTPWGYGGYGASHTVADGRLTVLLGIVDCEHYDGEYMQTHLEISDAGSLFRSIHVDFGDGTTYDTSGSTWTCDSPNRPNPYYGSAPFHTYTAAGTYTVTASVTTSSCSAWPDTHQLVDDQTVTVTITTYQIAGRRPAN